MQKKSYKNVSVYTKSTVALEKSKLQGEKKEPLKDLRNDHVRKGSVLNDNFWWPFKNDSWILGGVHGLRFFHLTMAKVPDTLIWASKENRPRMLGRELIGLKEFGYSWVAEFGKGKKPSISQKLINLTGMVFAPTDRSKAEGASFEKYRNAIKKYTSEQSISDAMLKSPIPYSKYDYKSI